MNKAAFLNAQNAAKMASEAASEMVRCIKEKNDWRNKIKDPIIREKYLQEAVEQGISLEIANKALSILDSLSKCYPTSFSTRQPAISIPSPASTEEIFVRVGDHVISTTLATLTADSESMLNRMFSPPWIKSTNEPTQILSISNSPKLFAHILLYLEALRNENTNLCPNLDDMSPEEISQLLEDCEYFGFRRFIIAIKVRLWIEDNEVEKRQKSTSKSLSEATRRLKLLVEEKARIEKRLLELPELISQAEEKAALAEAQRNMIKTKWIPQLGDNIVINHQGDSWTKCKVILDDDGHLCAQQIGFAFWALEQPDGGQKIPLPPPTHYHSESKLQQQLFRSAYSFDECLPEVLSDSLEQHLDQLLHEQPLDLHPGSDGHVVDLIHPSLFPYIKDLSPVSDENEFNNCVPVTGNYSWLPAEFFVDSSGLVTIESYINNLDRSTYPELYFDISQLFQFMLPIFETVLNKSLRSCHLQVIVKAAYYFIPPGETYEGSWHVEGMPYENIVANGIYYLHSSEHIYNNHIEFRSLQTEFYQYNGPPGTTQPLVSEVGWIETPSRRGLVWDNQLYQHKVGSLTVDPECPQSGIRKIICFFLVDPSVRIISTKIVPPQQEIIPLQIAKQHRQKLMNDRKYQATADAQDWESRTYTFCEH